MRKILILGAGHSAPFLIHYLLEQAAALDASVTVADADEDAARRRVGNHERGRAVALDINDHAALDAELADASVVVHMLPPRFQAEIARRALAAGVHMVSASYRADDVASLDDDARARGVALLTELGLDPGIDLMSAQRLIEEIRERGGRVDRFLSYGGGLPDKSFRGNPLRYCITWNPRNVAMSGEHGAQYLRRGRIHLEPRHRVFPAHWPVEVPGLGRLDGYANRDSIAYREVHGLEHVRTLVRGTLRWPGYCDVWDLIVRLGLPTEDLHVPHLQERTWAELTTMFLPHSQDTAPGVLRERVARLLGVESDDRRLDVLEWLGIFSERRVGGRGDRPADGLAALLEERLPLPPGVRDLVVLHHEIDARVPSKSAGRLVVERTHSTFVCHGEPNGFTAMARTVGLPAALGVRLLLEGRLSRRGCLGPTDPEIFHPVLDALEAEGLRFEEQSAPIDGG
ncbi:MAG: saccharopine dehydrogenase C-terminal domain-containing protein [Acidobacteriota bacterium]